MQGWGYWEWLGYICIAVAAAMPAIGAAMSSDRTIKRKSAKLLNSRFWRFTPAVALLISAGIIVANQFGWTRASAPQVITKTAVVKVSDPAQQNKINQIAAQLQQAERTIQWLYKNKGRYPQATAPQAQASPSNSNTLLLGWLHSCQISEEWDYASQKCQPTCPIGQMRGLTGKCETYSGLSIFSTPSPQSPQGTESDRRP